MAEGATLFEAWHLRSHRMLQRGFGARVIARRCRGWSKRGGWAADPQPCEAIVDLDLLTLAEIDPPRGYGRD
jgi:hypothetical protein